ncbi:MAG: DNA replication/repair protein RecF [Pseudomonadales bacterium]
MSIRRLSLTNFRNIKGADLETDSPFVVFYGDNAAGKTSVLEAVHLLLAGRSFRTRESSKLIAQGENQTFVSALIERHQLGTSRSSNDPAIYRIDGANTTIPEIARQFPVQVFDNRIFDLFEGPPKLRRQLLDWGVFHVKQEFYFHWQAYQHAVKQRNALLKKTRVDRSQIAAWDHELIRHGQLLHDQRSSYAGQLVEACEKSELLKDMELRFSYFPGWNIREFPDFKEALFSAANSRDLQYKRTTVGPHQADLRIQLQTRKAGDVLSRGQKKLAGFGIKLAQVKMYNEALDKKCILLCDDFSAELDEHNQKRILNYMHELGSQVFVTSIESQEIQKLLTSYPESLQLFHVKQGQVVPSSEGFIKI